MCPGGTDGESMGATHRGEETLQQTLRAVIGGQGPCRGHEGTQRELGRGPGQPKAPGAQQEGPLGRLPAVPPGVLSPRGTWAATPGRPLPTPLPPWPPCQWFTPSHEIEPVRLQLQIPIHHPVVCRGEEASYFPYSRQRRSGPRSGPPVPR